jgi:hypothetical protein
MELISFFNIYPTRNLFICLTAALALASVSCERDEEDQLDPTVLSEDEIYLIGAYVEVKRAHSHYPHNPAAAESLFLVLDSTIDSLRIANTIRTVNQDPERWALVFEEIEKILSGEAGSSGIGDPRKQKPPSQKPGSGEKSSEQAGG